MFIAVLALILLSNVCISQSQLSFRSKKKVFSFISALLLFVIHCFKEYANFFDLPEYVATFDYLVYGNIEDASFFMKSEPGWLYFNKLLTSISKNHLILFISHSLVVIYAYMITIKKYSYIPWLSVFLFITGPFNQSMYVMRQHLAIAICILSVPFILDRNFVKFIFVVLLASTIHYTALVFVPSYFIYSFKFDKKFWLTLSLVGIISFVLFHEVVNYIMSNLEIGYSSYAEKEGANYTAFLISSCILLLIIFSLRFKDLQDIDKLVVQLFLLGYIISLSGIGVSITSRLNMYFTVFNMLVIPLSIVKLKRPFKYFALIPIFILYLYMWLSKDMEGYKFLISI